jgi:hypothetical protein
VSASLPGLSGPDIQHEHETTLIGYEASTEGEQKSKKAKKSKKKKQAGRKYSSPKNLLNL